MRSFVMLVSLFLVILICILIGIYYYFLPPIPSLKKQKYPYALLLGCPSHDDGSMATSQIKRCELAIEAYQKNLFDTLVISGGAVKNQYTESKEMAKFIQQKSSMPIICETQARNTYENFKNSSRITQDVPILILTGSLHAKRSCAIAKEFYSNYSAYTYPDHKLRHIIRNRLSIYLHQDRIIKKGRKILVSCLLYCIVLITSLTLLTFFRLAIIT